MSLSGYLGHSASQSGRTQPLVDHIQGVARRTHEALEGWYAHDEAMLAALLHDLGKYTESFQRRLQGLEKGLDHWSSGAWACLQLGSMAAAMAVYGHHVGLPGLQFLKGKKQLEHFESRELRLTGSNLNEQLDLAKGDGINPSGASQILTPANLARVNKLGCQLDLRRLFSALVDADFLDTEEHFRDEARSVGETLEPNRDLERLLEFRMKVATASTATESVKAVREEVFQACLEAAAGGQAVYTLTAPTGAGKTLAMLAFAMKHAQVHGLRRIVTVLPFLTLIEQTAGIYRSILPPGETLIEHHSLADEDPRSHDSESADPRRIRQLTENWDAPYIVTTNVQFFESLFARRPGKCRKLHRLAESVILLDEVQTLPRPLALVTLAALSHLQQHWGCTVVMATATQPAYETVAQEVTRIHPAGWSTKPIVADPRSHFQRLKRTRYEIKPETCSMTELAEEVLAAGTALVVVNLKRHASQLWGQLSQQCEYAEHLSTSMCAAHRAETLARVRGRLREKSPTILVSTQCIEAGVDLDFPRLFRSLAPWDSMVQAAGRCNREGRLEEGLVTLFSLEEEKYPNGYYQAATDVARTLLRRNPGAHLDDPELVSQFFKLLYSVSELNHKELAEAIDNHNFEKITEQYRLIKDDSINVVVPYPPLIEEYYRLQGQAHSVNRNWFRRARPLSVTVYRPKVIWDCLAPVQAHRTQLDDWFVYTQSSDYHPNLGLIPPDGPADLIF